MIKFNNIELEGFGSIVSKTFFRLDCNGLNIIRGKIGSGKTTIPSGLYWGLYGITLKPNATVQTWEEYRPENFKGTISHINFHKDKDEYDIIRCISYKGNILEGMNKKGGSGLFIVKNKKLINIKGKKNIMNRVFSRYREIELRFIFVHLKQIYERFRTTFIVFKTK